LSNAKAAVLCSTDPGDGWIEKIRLDRRRGSFSAIAIATDGRANARPMTGSAKQSIVPRKERMDCSAPAALRARVESTRISHHSSPTLARR
jgi:hypothetical protein